MNKFFLASGFLCFLTVTQGVDIVHPSITSGDIIFKLPKSCPMPAQDLTGVKKNRELIYAGNLPEIKYIHKRVNKIIFWHRKSTRAIAQFNIVIYLRTSNPSLKTV